MKIRDKSSQKERPWGYGIEQKKKLKLSDSSQVPPFLTSTKQRRNKNTR